MKFVANQDLRIRDAEISTSRFREVVLGITISLLTVFMLSSCGAGTSSGEGVDPGIVEVPIAFIKRPFPLDDMGVQLQADLRDPLLFSQGGDVFLRSSSAVGATLTNVSLGITGGNGDVKGLNVSHDGSRLIFSLRLFDDPDDDIVPSWNIYEYDITTARLHRVITDSLTAEAGDDLYPSYLADGRIVFTSNRQKQSGINLINEGKPSYRGLVENENQTLALVLHVMNPDGTGLRQISFNQSHDLYPQVMSQLYGGKIVFSRWDHAVTNDGIHLYSINPDGSELELLYGMNSHFTGSNGGEIQFTGLRETENGNLMVITRPFTDTFDGGNIEIIDAARFTDDRKPVWSLAGLGGRAQQAATVNPIINDGSISVAGRYASAYPLWDGSGRILVSKSDCQLSVDGQQRPCIDPYLSDPDAIESAPTYAIWLYDRNENTEKPIVLAESDTIFTEVVALQGRVQPPIIFDKTGSELDVDQLADNVGVINIKSVYDLADTSFDACYFDQCSSATGINNVQDFADPLNATAVQRPARFVRFIKPVALPSRDDVTLENPPDLANTAFGLRRNRGMREILGYAPVEPDGSVKTRVPAGIPLALEVVDAEGRRIGPMHFNWFQVQAGDTLTCKGCHTHDTGAAVPEIHGRDDASAPSINSGLPASLQLINTLIPGTSGPYWGDFGQTMAEVRFDRYSLASPSVVEPQLSVDLVFDDYWTDPGVRTPDLSYAYRYSDLGIGLLSPANNFCTPWEFNCRSIINYPEHIQAIWQADRGVDLITPDAPDNPPTGDPTNTPLLSTATPNLVGDNTCIECHTSKAGTRLPYGQLDLTIDPNQNPNQFFRSYSELFITKAGRMFDGMNLVPITRSVPDGMGGFVDEIDPTATVAPSMSPVGARASYFMEKMTGTELDATGRNVSGTVDHRGMLNPAELKLIAEWLDLGGQNFNDPFNNDAPQN